MKKTAKIAIVLVSAFAGMTNAWADCASLPNQAALKAALVAAVTTESSGLDLNMWATIVDRDGIVCAVAFSGTDRGAQWPGSRVISAQKANTANAFSLPGLRSPPRICTRRCNRAEVFTAFSTAIRWTHWWPMPDRERTSARAMTRWWTSVPVA